MMPKRGQKFGICASGCTLSNESVLHGLLTFADDLLFALSLFFAVISMLC